MARSLPSAYRYRSTEKILMPPELQKQCAEERGSLRSFASMATWSRWTRRRTTTPMCCVCCNRRHKGCGGRRGSIGASDAAPESGRNVRGKSE